VAGRSCNGFCLAAPVPATTNDATTHDIWSAATTSYFTAGESGSVKVATTGGASYSDAGRIGDLATHYYYLILATAGNCPLAASQRVGAFDFALTPGSLMGVAAGGAADASTARRPALPDATLSDTSIANFA